MLVKGSIVAIVTPMKANGDLDLDALDKLVDFHIKSGTKGIIAVGTTGESATLEVSEHISVIERIVNRTNNKIFIFAGTGANSTKEAIYLSKAAKSAGANASLSVTPYYNKPTQEGLFQHYTQIADQVDFPQVLYNVPGRTSCDLLPETIAKLAPHENILGIKEATGDLSRLEELKKLLRDETFFLYSGDDATATDFILNGGHGNISVTANIVPELMSKLCDLALEKSPEAKIIENKISNLNTMLFLESNPIPVKWVLNRMGLMDIGIRLPLTNLSKQHQQTLEEELKRLKLI
ncbi:MAG: 4-hydroxy-tetrahydrodipicolinate synthase [Gammaproteobacteria bacterium]|tara:strand:- start:745 stop:1623 length:879 start_codon:yes stop_codon:yes gene_type:complete